MHSSWSMIRILFVVGITVALVGSRGFAQSDDQGDEKATEKPSASKTEAEKPATEKPATEKPAIEKTEAPATKESPAKNPSRLKKKESAASPLPTNGNGEKTEKSDKTDKTEAAKSESPKTQPAKAPAKARDPNEKVRFFFEGVAWERVIRMFADYWGFALHNSSWPSGTFNYTDPHPLDQKQQMDAMNSFLLTKGFVMARRDQVLLLHNLKDGPVPDPWVPLARREDVGDLGEFELRKMIFPVDRADFDTVAKEVKNIVEPPAVEGSSGVKLPGRVIELPASKQLFVVETGGNLRSIDGLIRGMSGDGVKAFKVEHITVNEAMLVLKPMLGIPADIDHNTDSTITLTPYAATKSILITAKGDVIKKVESILKLIDVVTKEGTGAVPELKIYPIAGDSQTIFQVLQTMLVGSPSVRLTRDPSNGNVVALALPEQHAIILETIEKMEGKGLKKFRSWQLASNADPAMVLATINELLGGGGQTSDATKGADAKSKVAPVMSGAPKVIINTNNRSMLAFGTDTQLKQIEELLTVQKWDAKPKDPALVTASTVRLLPFHRDAVDLIKEHFPSMRKNPIEVVVPSRGSRNDSVESSPGREKESMHKSLLRTPSGRASEGEKSDGKKPTTQDRGPERTTLRMSREPSTTYVAHRVSTGELLARRDIDGNPVASEVEKTGSEKAGSPMKTKSAYIGPEKLNAPRGTTPDRDKPRNGPGSTERNTEPKPEKKTVAPTRPSAKPEVTAPGELPGSAEKPVKITVTDKGLVISCEDPAALDAIEELLALLPADPLASGNFKIYYLKHMTAVNAKQELDQILTGDTTESGGTTASGNLVGDVARGIGGGLMGTMVEGLLGQGSAGGVGSLVSGNALIVPDERLNALIVQASPGEQSLIEQVLYYIDAEDGPDTKVARKPGMIPVFSTSADEIAAIVKELYSDRMITGRGQGGQQPSPQEFIAALRGGGGGRKQQNQRRAEEADKMTIGVDKRSNSLIVVAPKPLFDEVDRLVQVLDYASETPSNEVRSIVHTNGVSGDTLARAIKAIAGDKVQTMTAGQAMPGPSAGPSAVGGTPSTQPGGTAPTGAPTDGASQQERVQRFLQMQQAFGGGRGFGGPGGGGPGSGGFGGPGGGGPGGFGGRKGGGGR